VADYYFLPRETKLEIFLVLPGNVLSCSVERSISMLGGCREGEGIFDIPGSDSEYFMIGEQALRVLTPIMREKARKVMAYDSFMRPCALLHVSQKKVHPGIDEISTPKLLPLSWQGLHIPQEEQW